MTSRVILCALLMVAAGAGLAGCGTLPSGASAFDDCYSRPPLYQQEHGCYERQ